MLHQYCDHKFDCLVSWRGTLRNYISVNDVGFKKVRLPIQPQNRFQKRMLVYYSGLVDSLD